jgi:cytochrome P450
MTFQPLLVLSATFILHFLYKSFKKIRDNAHFRAFALANGCEEPPLLKSYLPYGIDILARLITFKGDILDDLIYPLYLDHGYYIYRQHRLAGDNIHTVNIQNIQTILSHRFKDFGIGEKRKSVFAQLVGPGIFTSDGQEWEHSRAFLRPQFSRDQFNNLEAMERHMQNLFRVLEKTMAQGCWTKEADLLELFFEFTMDSTTEFLLGESNETLLAHLQPATKISSLPSKDDSAKPTTSVSEQRGSRCPPNGQSFPDAFHIAEDFLSFQVRIPKFL